MNEMKTYSYENLFIFSLMISIFGQQLGLENSIIYTFDL